MNFTRICWTLPAFVICLSSAEGQTLDEQLMGTGFEPAVNCDRVVDPQNSQKRIQFLWMDPFGMPPGIDWKISHDRGALGSWTAPVVFPKGVQTRGDPFAVCNIWTDPNTTRHMYLGWFVQFDSNNSLNIGDYFLRSLVARSQTGETLDAYATRESSCRFDGRWVWCLCDCPETWTVVISAQGGRTIETLRPTATWAAMLKVLV